MSSNYQTSKEALFSLDVTSNKCIIFLSDEFIKALLKTSRLDYMSVAFNNVDLDIIMKRKEYLKRMVSRLFYKKIESSKPLLKLKGKVSSAEFIEEYIELEKEHTNTVILIGFISLINATSSSINSTLKDFKTLSTPIELFLSDDSMSAHVNAFGKNFWS